MHQVFDLITPVVAWIVVAGVLIFTAIVAVRRRRAPQVVTWEPQTSGTRKERLAPSPSPGAPPEAAEQFTARLREEKAAADEGVAAQPPVPAMPPPSPQPAPPRRRRLSRRVQGAVIWSLVFGILTVYTMIGFLAFGIAFDFERVLFLAATVWGIGVQVYTLMAGA